MNRILGISLAVAIVFLNGCTVTKRLEQLEALVKKLEARIEALEKLLTPPKEEEAVQQAPYDVPVLDSPVLGNKDAPVHIVVFSNFQCPHCANADKALRQVVEDEELKNKVNVVFKHFPFEWHPEARPASKAALAANEQGKFWPMAEKIFSQQGEMSQSNYKKWAEDLGLDVNKFAKDLKDHDQKYNEIIDRDLKSGDKDAHLKGTPWILVGGWLLDGAPSVDAIKKIIKEKQL